MKPPRVAASPLRSPAMSWRLEEAGGGADGFAPSAGAATGTSAFEGGRGAGPGAGPGVGRTGTRSSAEGGAGGADGAFFVASRIVGPSSGRGTPPGGP